MKGIISVEGTDGSGLSTQAMMLADYLKHRGLSVVLTKEQTDSIIGGLIRSSLREEWKVSPLALQLLFAADRAHHLASEILPALEADRVVVCDRYILSTLAYGSLDLDMDYLKLINKEFPAPSMTFLLDVPADVCISRIHQSRQGMQLFEEKESLEKLRNNFMSLRGYFPNTYVINGNLPKDQVFAQIQKIVDSKLG